MTELTDYPDGETPTDPPTEQDSFNPHTGWENYWDYHPITHGGTFVRWHTDQWEIVETHPVDDGDGWTVYVDRYWFEPQDVWADPDDPETGFTDAMKSVIDSLGESHYPNGDGNPFLERITYYVADLKHHTGSQRRHDTVELEPGDVSGYWDAIGVDPAGVEHLSDDERPDE